MWPDRVSNPGPLTFESGALPAVLRCLVVHLSIGTDWSQQTVQIQVSMII